MLSFRPHRHLLMHLQAREWRDSGCAPAHGRPAAEPQGHAERRRCAVTRLRLIVIVRSQSGGWRAERRCMEQSRCAVLLPRIDPPARLPAGTATCRHAMCSRHQTGFWHLNYDLVMNVARAARQAGVKVCHRHPRPCPSPLQHMALVTAIGANSRSWFYYFAAKGAVRGGVWHCVSVMGAGGRGCQGARLRPRDAVSAGHARPRRRLSHPRARCTYVE